MIISQETVEFDYPEAFEALPECYQADSCLEFSMYGGLVYACPKKDQEFALGVWVSVWDANREVWVSKESRQVKSHR